MSSSLKTKEQMSLGQRSRDFTGTLDAPLRPTERRNKNAWEMRLSFSQLVVLWSMIAGVMVMVFLFGLYAGREQGLRAALENYANETVRLPVINPVALNDASGSARELPNVTENNGSGSIAGAPVSQSVKTDSVPAIDFSAQQVSRVEEVSQQKESDARLAAKPTSELFKQELVVADRSDVAVAGERAEVVKKSLEEKANAAKTETRVESVASEKKVPSGWYVQVAATRTEKEAGVMLKKFKRAGLAAKVEEAMVNGSSYFRLVVGPYGSKEAAVSGQKQIKRTKVAKGESFVKQIR